MSKRWCSIKEIEVYFLCEILISKVTLQGQKTVVSLLNRNCKHSVGADSSMRLKINVQWTFLVTSELHSLELRRSS